jgi:hypothetical protein
MAIPFHKFRYKEGDGDLALVTIPLSTREDFTLLTRAYRRNQLTTAGLCISRQQFAQ